MSAKTNIKKYGTDITNVPVSKLPKNLNRVGFVVINCYIGTRYSLGDGPMNDGYNMAKCLKRYGYQVYYLLDSKRQAFLDKFDFFLRNATGELAFFYVGHGTNVADANGDEDDGQDEALVFVDGNIVDDDLLASLEANKNPDNKLILISDCCHSGTVWDLQSKNINGRKIPAGVVSVSAANDKQTAKQTVADRVEQGMFTYNLMKALKTEPNMSALECKKRLATALRRYAQTVTIASTTPELLNEPLFNLV
ncbi:Clan CD, family C14, metacaspase-like cysteine peptidase [Trichomonas vaginalis G3]|uniref:Clan CD, family C14, metacaspase-like cysteine peptidase n=1 Tax=Trichomonas vaginalis (strain ATCC PRA-98 / G3) TaxID=412133 RepID=A2EEY8_TRIV3|nr:cysteine-type peptidase protein [Trichomonas vaginalis G3]EAY08786.1 Clan CD, family C14, metacaspase-like cysteine peptidase [Trichomonas vaginalis G3]KAI5515118.1 cysteine-type peptidase protein [Trichomonas vaginalis G3]|eukprot:XP_001321009.1 Clan CD, family C14, metacaspase-like cysteine peptidase [Trichomonas vaginalis G3]